MLIPLILISLCVSENTSENEDIINLCIQECQTTTKDLTNGPCLLDPIPNTDWVCDVAHNPRQSIDNLAENQCQSYREGTAKHFVEVDENCDLIKTG